MIKFPMLLNVQLLYLKYGKINKIKQCCIVFKLVGTVGGYYV